MKRKVWTAGSVALGFASLVLVQACESSPPGTQGELGQGSFTYECLSAEDHGCIDAPYDGAELPEGIAVGSKFNLKFHGEEAARILSGSESLAETLEGSFFARAPGKVAMMAQATAEDRIVDFVHLDLFEVGEIELTGTGTGATQALEVGDSWTWTASPKSLDGSPLAGTLVCKWASSDTSVVRFTQTSDTHRNEVHGMSAGTAVVTVSVGAASKSLEVTVE